MTDICTGGRGEVCFLPQPSTAASLLDRLLHHAVIVVTDGESFRMKEARSRAAVPRSRIATEGGRHDPAPVA